MDYIAALVVFGIYSFIAILVGLGVIFLLEQLFPGLFK